jgi:hypothetical protein
MQFNRINNKSDRPVIPQYGQENNRMATEKQIAANRANALKSTGPKTPEGKAKSSRNALRHGLLAKTVLLRAGCEEGFNVFVAGFYAEYSSSSATEVALVDGMATARWRAMRLSKIEAVQIDREFDQQHDPAFEHLDNATRTGFAYREAAANSGALHLIDRVEASLQRQFDSSFDRLMVLQSGRQKRFQDREATAPPRARRQTDPIDL